MRTAVQAPAAGTFLAWLLRDAADETVHGWLVEESDEGELLRPDDDSSGSDTASAVARRTILVVDDDDLVRAMIVASVEDDGYDVMEAADGLDAMAALEKYGAEIIALVSDIKMPGIDGLELARTVTCNWPRIAIVLVSGYPPGGQLADVPEAAVFLPKPFRTEQMAEAVRRALAFKNGN
jgi:CheY-like chemotaxis protein